MKMKLGVLWCIVLTLPHVRSYFLPSGKQCKHPLSIFQRPFELDTSRLYLSILRMTRGFQSWLLTLTLPSNNYAPPPLHSASRVQAPTRTCSDRRERRLCSLQLSCVCQTMTMKCWQSFKSSTPRNNSSTLI